MLKTLLMATACACITNIGTAQIKKSNYKTEQVTFKNADQSIIFGGTLTLPSGIKHFPTVVIVSGTGKQNRDGEMAGHKEFLTISDSLVKNGIAVLRTDDRGTGQTTGIYETATTGDFGDDALAAINYLRTRPEIDSAKIGLIGHSEGGAAMAIAAAKSNKIKFLVSLSGLATSGYESLLKQNEDIVNSAPIPDYDKKRYNDVNTLMFAVAHKYADSTNMEAKLNEAYAVWKKKDSIYFSTLNIQFDHFRFPIYSWSKSAVGPWYRYFLKYDAQKTMSKIHVPILALNGDKDLMVAYKENLDNWKKFPTAGGNSDVTIHIMQGLNHLFLPCIKCTTAEYAEIKSDFSPKALQIITDWIKMRFK
ncbi:alpha/beta hydrolase [Mucilaginibacter rubeus]|uniref:Alpha/beta fold hydrolase n=1 Tax=Mucilaginibacter rubeus TaxID=2027860 RepID=A0AAE6JJS3_9SPHI|nr:MULTISPECIES: alpha/beta fold hydrolase [Mucilaginibacter]QEM07152.1 alpha/beta hydrolase [Mucilaginibacter rubeus]QEM19607.1 alpha/beta hydrolase [Mucilaginibacter gossypii]QTE43703.1 alpha/beta fold hydrolase [Mucilaginibacter rubeus]QTE50303.1 alpha/beta fold hydrolase [Mucilaginibacter rubeus]QTE55390.1 alpha/beta fold hydrolase [Mucilaginibacter rubeus]